MFDQSRYGGVPLRRCDTRTTVGVVVNGYCDIFHILTVPQISYFIQPVYTSPMSVEWCESAIVLAARPHGESSVIATLLTANYGAHAGLVQAARGRKGGSIQPGNRVVARWRARLPEHLGSYTIEAESNGAAALMHEPLRLVALQSACSLVAVSAPEREPHPGLY